MYVVFRNKYKVQFIIVRARYVCYVRTTRVAAVGSALYRYSAIKTKWKTRLQNCVSHFESIIRKRIVRTVYSFYNLISDGGVSKTELPRNLFSTPFARRMRNTNDIILLNILVTFWFRTVNSKTQWFVHPGYGNRAITNFSRLKQIHKYVKGHNINHWWKKKENSAYRYKTAVSSPIRISAV